MWWRKTWPVVVLIVAILLAIDAAYSVMTTCDSVGEGARQATGGQPAGVTCGFFNGPLVAWSQPRLVRLSSALAEHAMTVIALFAVVLALSTMALWGTIERLYETGETHRKNADRMAERQGRDFRQSIAAARDSASAADASARAMQQAVEMSQSRLQVLERAYLSVTPSDVTVLPDRSKVEVGLAVHNVGRTPAFVKKIHAQFSREAPQGDAPTYVNGSGEAVDVAVASGATHKLPLRYADGYVGPQFIWGYVTFADIFRDAHTTRFCMQIFPNGDAPGHCRVAGSPAWNDFD
jgi:hypothetical protein